MLLLISLLLIITLLWAISITFLFFYNPFPFPDRGHRVFGVKDEQTRFAVVNIIEKVTGKKSRYTFDSGNIHQTILQDGYTSIHYIDGKIDSTPPCAISFAVENPFKSAQKAIQLLKMEGFDAEIVEDLKTDLPSNYLVPIRSNAFDGWALVFRRPLLKMPKPKVRA